MDLFLKGRGVQITERIRRVAEHKLAKLERFDPRIRRIEVQIIEEPTPRIEGGHRVEVTCQRGRRILRAEGTGHDVDAAFDQVIHRLERQISTHRGKIRNRLVGRGNRLKSTRTSPEEAGSSE